MRKQTRSPGAGTTESVDVENGRLSAALREVLAELGVATSTETAPDDLTVVIVRDADGRMTVENPGSNPRGSIDDLVPVCWSVAAGANLTGRISVRVRRGDNGPVFVSVEAP